MIKTVLPALAGIAFGMGGAAAISQPATIVQKAFGCHRSCERGPVPRWGDVVRWHRHAGPRCAPVPAIRAPPIRTAAG